MHAFHWMTYAFGAFLIYSGFRLWTRGDAGVQPESNAVLRLFRRFVPVTANYEGEHFLVRRSRILATPLLVVLLVVESTDVLFATDSIPAVLAVTLNTLIAYTSNVLAVLGLRSLFFLLARVIEIFHYLHYGLSLVLIFVGGKMLVSDYYRIPTGATLAAVAGILLASVLISIAHPKPQAS